VVGNEVMRAFRVDHGAPLLIGMIYSHVAVFSSSRGGRTVDGTAKRDRDEIGARAG
jgi:hypothetical protein